MKTNALSHRNLIAREQDRLHRTHRKEDQRSRREPRLFERNPGEGQKTSPWQTFHIWLRYITPARTEVEHTVTVRASDHIAAEQQAVWYAMDVLRAIVVREVR